jgi:hypothetical protein
MKIYEGEKQKKLDAVQTQLARHEKITRIVLVAMVILAGLALVVLTHHLFDLLPLSNK